MHRDVAAVERRNLAEIERLNQRGGRTLSIVDLIEDGTITPRMAAFCWLAVGQGASVLTGALPGGVGKTTLMATLLSFLPPGERIVTVEDGGVLARVFSGDVPAPVTLMAHEIGSGRWFGYIWGRQAAQFFGTWQRGIRRVSCLHADDPEQTCAALLPLGVTEDDLGRIGLQLYMCARRGPGGVLRRVGALHCVLAGRLRRLWQWLPAEDRFEQLVECDELCKLAAAEHGVSAGDVQEAWEAREACLEELRSAGVRRFEAVRAGVVEFGRARG